eukprot:15448003-Alexandrium_andersonii.AAC.1
MLGGVSVCSFPSRLSGASALVLAHDVTAEVSWPQASLSTRHSFSVLPLRACPGLVVPGGVR